MAGRWIVNWPWLHEDPARLLRPLGLLPITLFGVFVLVTALPLYHVMKADISGPMTPTRKGPAPSSSGQT